ncbi:hypothetical protein [Gemmata sp.]|uniref:hypothetical protein n=1 Tax=Gemmata sp. TaxID=1914242 RepID=UPI003F6EA1D9
MGLDRTVRFPTEVTPPWGAIRTHLQRVGESGQLRMIDGLPAFPDEEPADAWSELRVGTAAGMVTVRRRPGALVCVTWGNSDPALSAAWGKVTWACAAAGGGVIDTPTGPVPAAEFAAAEGIAPA